MTLLAYIESDDPTVKLVSESDRRLAILCSHCGRFRYMNSSRFAGNQRVSDLSETLTCAACGSRDVKAVAVSRDPDNGYWPAERS
jgi:transcription elongation factor Elf1